jgi:DNA-directed RNA polymerase subunit RPC12/RpoP
MDATSVDALSGSESASRRNDQRLRGVCEKCGRVLVPASEFGSEVQLLCDRCGFRTTAKRRSRAYRAAVINAQSGRSASPLMGSH